MFIFTFSPNKSSGLAFCRRPSAFKGDKRCSVYFRSVNSQKGKRSFQKSRLKQNVSPVSSSSFGSMLQVLDSYFNNPVGKCHGRHLQLQRSRMTVLKRPRQVPLPYDRNLRTCYMRTTKKAKWGTHSVRTIF